MSDSNPEVMGRTEPRTVTAHTDTSPELSEIKRRFEELQSQFIEQPQEAVKKAERLTEEAIEGMTKAIREQMSTIHREHEGDTDTERLRLAMRRYRMLIDSIGRSQAA
ncbi:MAG: hypothetical protein E6I53_12795 [Chloroflexi bacterium]|nr:MAG: hypothetical protein E6I53_12795 [Chloroflexota bacterium]